MNQYTAKSLEDLLNKVAQEKNVPVEDLVYHVVEEKAGFLGLGASVTAEVYALSDVSQFAKDYIASFLNGFDIDAEVEVEQRGSNLSVSINAENNAILIGRGGKSLEGLGQLLRQVVSAEFKRRFFVRIDINNYKSDRYEKLKSMARRIAKQVQRSKIDVSLDPMPNDERRVIHKELTDYAHVRTVSEGDGRNRHLKIVFDANKE